MKIKAQCRTCLRRPIVIISKRNWPHRKPAVTGIPCPGCGKHTLKRVREENVLARTVRKALWLHGLTKKIT